MEVVELHGRVMASRLHIIAVGGDEGPGGIDLHSAMSETGLVIDHLERCWSRFLQSSDVSLLNQIGPEGGTLCVDPSTVTLLRSMITGYQVTAGRFDPTVLRALMAAGYRASHVDPTRITAVAEGVSRPGALLDLEVDPETNMVRVPAGLVLDPGGIGKGLAADLAVAHLLALGVAGAMVEIGGDLAMAGRSVDPSGWRVDVEHPDRSDGLLCSLAVSGGGVATSSVRSRRWMKEGREHHHQIDPRTATCSTTDLVTVTVIAPTGWLAEVHATAALSMGGEAVIGYLEGHGLSGIAVTSDAGTDAVLHTADLAGIAMDVRMGVR